MGISDLGQSTWGEDCNDAMREKCAGSIRIIPRKLFRILGLGLLKNR